MIVDRLYQPAEGELLFHYSGLEGFQGIINSRTLWASSYQHLNDPSERLWGHLVFYECCSQLEADFEKRFLDAVKEIVEMVIVRSHLMVCSFTLHPDSNSQWERYAENGEGYCLGFSANDLRLPGKPLRIEYDMERQFYEVMGNLRHMYEYQEKLGFPFEYEFQEHCIRFGLDLCAYKDPQFGTEKEVRYAHVASLSFDEHKPQILPTGAVAHDGTRLCEPCTVHIRKREDMEVPYVALDWTDQGKVAPLELVTLGPFNQTSEESVSELLASTGLNEVRVTRSRIVG